MSNLKTLTTRLIAISALGVVMIAPAIAATESTANTLNNPANTTTPVVTEDTNAVPTTQVRTAEQAAEAAATEADAATTSEAEATDSAK